MASPRCSTKGVPARPPGGPGPIRSGIAVALIGVLGAGAGCGEEPRPEPRVRTADGPMTAFGVTDTPLRYDEKWSGTATPAADGGLPEPAPAASLPADGGAMDAGPPGACRSVALGGRRRTVCCPDALRELIRPDEVIAACDGAEEYLYESWAEESACMYLLKKGDVVLKVQPGPLHEMLRAKIEGRPGFVDLPELGPGGFNYSPGKSWNPWERRYYVRNGDRMLSASIHPKTCSDEEARALMATISKRFFAGAGGPAIPEELDRARLKEMLPGARDPTPPAPVPKEKLPR